METSVQGDQARWSLDRWFDSSKKNCSLDLIIVSERTAPDRVLLRRALRRWLRYCYVDDSYVDERVRSGAFSSREELYQQEQFPDEANGKVRKGDLGEAIGHYLLEQHPSLSFRLPVIRLRSKEEADSARKGFDLLGFRFSELDGINALCIGEVKFRTARAPNTIVDAHTSLAKYTRRREIKQIGKIAKALQIEGDTRNFDRMARFGNGWAAQSFERCHVLIGVFDSQLDLDGMITKAEELPSLLPAFRACIVVVDELKWWYEEAFGE